ncbi:phosducin-like protein 2 [[Candida] anglica]|uniref:Phosducin-like protein 2 n=1 Tax=[Candida] anglica TaxID=148631 RepID=A0ABP0EKR5_9ASCO
MDNFKIPVEVDPTEDTEWNDILREKGIIPQRPPSPTEELDNMLEEAVRKQHENRLENKDMDELDALEEEEDEEFLNFYKQKRMKQIEELTKKQKFGSVYPVTKPEYKEEVTDASMDNFVFLHMSLSSNLQSRLLSALTSQLASKFPEIKFCEIPANRCVENYPESNCPTIIIYHNKDVIKQYVTLMQLGGNDAKLADLERVLVAVDAVKDSDKRLLSNQEDEDLEEERKMRFVKKSVRGRSNYYDDEEDDDFYD